ncbi:MAG: PLP-dependent cysteine synthase family protein [Coriobacteriia bacterium]
MDRTQLERRFRELGHLIGNTPLIAVDFRLRGTQRRVYAKAEHLNLTGSVKDRMALHVLQRAYERGDLAPDASIAEATSGNTGISFSAIGNALGHRVTIFMPDWMSHERIDLMRSFGADVQLVSREDGGFEGALTRLSDYATQNENCFLPAQFDNPDNCEAHFLTTGPEIYWQLNFEGLAPEAFVAGVGTGGTVMGIGSYLRTHFPDMRVHPLEPASSPTLRLGHKTGTHRIQGISDDFIPSILDLASLDDVIDVHDGDAIIMAQRLAHELGLGVGISSGANLLGAILAQDRLGPDAVVATVFPDDNKKYLSTALLRQEPVRDEYLAPHIELIGFTAIKRVCVTCCDAQECSRPMHDASGLPLPGDCPRRQV